MAVPNTAPTDARSSTSLSRQLLVALLTPLALLLVLGAVLGAQVLRMTDDAGWVDHSDRVLGTANDALRNAVDQETGVRGYLITRDRVFLESFERARVSELLDTLHELVVDSPVQTRRVNEIRARYDRWLAKASAVATGAVHFEDASTSASMLERKSEMDGIRDAVRHLVDAENELRHTRAQAATESNRVTRASLVGLVLLSAAVLGFVSRRQLESIVGTYTTAIAKEAAARKATEDEAWIREGHALVATAFQGDSSLSALAERGLRILADHVKADVGAIFTLEGGAWCRRAGYGVDGSKNEKFARGEALVGRAGAKDEVLHVTDVPAGYFALRSGTGMADVAEIAIAPAFADGASFAVVELGFLRKVEPRVLDLLERIGDAMAIAVRSAEYKTQLRDTLEESQRQAEELQVQQEELQAQQEELRVANEELEEQSNALKEANARSEERQEELTTMNARLAEQQASLVATQQRVLDKADEAERASRVKSEFLANMSHELRTPLNSSLILAKLLADNKPGNLSPEQVRFAETIYSAGNDLLSLINDILDLSKVEAGKMEVRAAEVSVERLVRGLERTFEPIAKEKRLAMTMTIEPRTPKTFESDSQRLEQVLKNLVSNAIKFTDGGAVTLTVSANAEHLRFAVRDTGIGIAKDQADLVFEAFRQADGTSARKHGGTGLGLSISRELAGLLGGTIELASTKGKGSTFTLVVPRAFPSVGSEVEPVSMARPVPGRAPSERPPSDRMLATPVAVEDDRARLDPTKRTALVVEDDVHFARILMDVAHERGFQCVVAHDAQSAMVLARKVVPAAVLLDVNLPDHSGLSVLDRLKHSPTTRHIPVHVLSADDHVTPSLAMGAAGFHPKPVDRDTLLALFAELEESASRVRRLLIIEDDDVQRESMKKLLESANVEIVTVSTVEAALAALTSGTFDCVVTDLTLPDGSGFDLLAQLSERKGDPLPPIIVYTGRALSIAEEQRLRRYSNSIIVKGARSPERLLDEVSLFLHQVEAELPAERQAMLREARDREAVFEGRRIMVVEDDVRNIFALTHVLESKGAKVVIARNGREALDVLAKTPDVALVLMDIMMPEMDGLEATREIRKNPTWEKLPILALTAKAMKDDQERCRQAGANDYVAKPLDVEMLLSLLRVWLPR